MRSPVLYCCSSDTQVMFSRSPFYVYIRIRPTETLKMAFGDPLLNTMVCFRWPTSDPLGGNTYRV